MTMTLDTRTTLELRDSILKLLSDEEIAKVSTAEAAPKLTDGDEYIDLEKLDAGVNTADGDPIPAGRILARVEVNPETWTEILNKLKITDQS
jgi:hypothetical protein